MRDLFKKVGSLLLGLGALSLLLANAALTHGCGGARRDAPAAQAGPPPSPPAHQSAAAVSAEPSRAGVGPAQSGLGATDGVAEPDCEKPAPYMYATKAPVMPLRPCGKVAPHAEQPARGSDKNNLQQQVP